MCSSDLAETTPNSCHVCEVEIDPETGCIEMVRYSAVHDVGTEINPLLVAGQVHGGIAQAAGVPEDRMPEYTMKGHAEPVYNDEALVEQAQPALIAALGKDKLMPGFPPVMGSEDFPLLVSGVENAKTLFVEVGGGPADVVKKYMATGELPPINHNPKFEIVDPGLAITTAIKANSALLMTFLKQ